MMLVLLLPFVALCLVGALTLMGLYQDGLTRKAQREGGLPRGPNLGKLLYQAVSAFLVSFVKKPKGKVD